MLKVKIATKPKPQIVQRSAVRSQATGKTGIISPCKFSNKGRI